MPTTVVLAVTVPAPRVVPAVNDVVAFPLTSVRAVATDKIPVALLRLNETRVKIGAGAPLALITFAVTVKLPLVGMAFAATPALVSVSAIAPFGMVDGAASTDWKLVEPVTTAVPTVAEATSVPAPELVPGCTVTAATPELLVNAVATGNWPADLLVENVTRVFAGTAAPVALVTVAVAVKLPPVGIELVCAPVLVLVNAIVTVPLMLGADEVNVY